MDRLSYKDSEAGVRVAKITLKSFSDNEPVMTLTS